MPGHGPGPQPVTPPPVSPYGNPPVYYDPAQSYVVYETVAAAGVHDPLISPDYAGWWRRSGALIRQTWVYVLPLQLLGCALTLLVTIPEALAANRYLADFANTVSTDPQAQPDNSGLLRVFGASLLVGALGIFVASVVAVAVNHIAVSAAAGVPPRIGAALALAARRILAQFGWQVIASLLLGVGLCACVLPAVYFYLVLMVLPVAVTFERGGTGVGRCFKLFHNNAGVAAGRVCTVAALTLLVTVVAFCIGAIVAMPDLNQATPAAGPFAAASTTSVIVRTVIGSLLSALLRTFTSIMTLTAYADMRARVEPLSTAMLAAEIGITPPAPTTPASPSPA